MGLISDIKEDLDKGALRLLSEYRGLLLNQARTLVSSPEEAEDLVFCTIERVLTKADAYDSSKSDLLTWMKAIMTNLHRDGHRRKLADAVTYCPNESLADAVDESATDVVQANSDGEYVRRVVASLPPELREVIVLQYFADQPVAKVAKILAIPPGTVATRVHLAKKILMKKLGPEFGKVKKPLAVLAALLFAATALFGAYQLAKVEEVVKVEEVEEVEEERGSGLLTASEKESEPSASAPANPPAESNVVTAVESISENTNKGTNEMNVVNSVRKLTKRLSTVAVAAGIAATTLGAVGETAVYVATNGNDSASGTSEEPLKTIAAAVAKGTDAVYVNIGTYVEHDIVLDRAVRVVGLAESRDDVIVNANSAGRCFSISHAQAVVSSLTMINGKATDKGGNFCLAGGTVTNCVVRDGKIDATNKGNGSNAYVDSGESMIVDSVFEGGVTQAKGGTILRAKGEKARIERCIFRNAPNNFSVFYALYLESGAVVENSLITGITNSGTEGYGIYLYGSGTAVVNCTLVGNDFRGGAGISIDGGAKVVNCLSVGNGTQDEFQLYKSSNNSCQWSDFVSCASPQEFDGCVTVSSIEAVGFNDFAAGDYSLGESSPLIGRGSASTYLEFARSSTDITGGARFSDGLISIGAYERAGLEGVIMANVTRVNWVYDGSARSCVLTVVSPGTGWIAKWCDVATDGESFPRDEAPAYSDPGLHTNVVRVSAPNCVDAYVTNVVYISAENTRFVAPTGNDAALGSKTDPFRTIGRALEFVKGFPGQAKVLVEDGTYYTGEWDLALDWAVEVRGISGDPAKVIVDANSAGRCFYLSHAQAVVSSLTMKNGKAVNKGGNFCLAGGIVTNCVVRDGKIDAANRQNGSNAYVDFGESLIVDSVFEGGATQTDSGTILRAKGEQARIQRCVFRNAPNNKPNFFALYLESGAVVENSLITGITGTTGYGIYLDGKGTAAVNCTVVGNACSEAGVMIYNGAKVVNCLSIGNGCSQEFLIYKAVGQWSDFVSCASPMELGGCVTVASMEDVCFKNAAKGNYAIRGASPLFKMGSMGAYAEYARSDTDLSGKPRFVKSGEQKISIGAYEGPAQGLIFLLK